MAAVEMDKVWRMIFLASGEQEAATADGDKSRPAAPLRDALRRPPQWIERAVETAIHARHCIAIELEFEAKQKRRERRQNTSAMIAGNSVASMGLAAGFSTDASAGQSKAELHDDIVPDPVPISEQFSVQEQVGNLHREGVQMARQLLPAGHPVRNRAEISLDQWLERTGGDGQPNLAPPPSLSRAISRRKMVCNVMAGSEPVSPTAPGPQQSLLTRSQTLSTLSQSAPLASSASAPNFSKISSGDLPNLTRLYHLKRLPPPGSTTGTQWSNASVQSMATTSVGSTSLPLEKSVQSSQYLSQVSYLSAPGGDVYVASLPKRSASPRKKKKVSRPSTQEGSRMNSKETRSPSKASAAAGSDVLDGPKVQPKKLVKQQEQEAALLLAKKDPFEDWRRNMVNENQMSHFQRQLRSNEGLRQLQIDLANEGRRFRNFTLNDIDAAVLCEMREKFGPAGMNVNKALQKKDDQFHANQVTEEALQKGGTRRELFQYYGTAIAGEQPGLSHLSKLLSKSHTHGRNLMNCAREEELRQLAAQREARVKQLGNKPGMQASGKMANKAAAKAQAKMSMRKTA
jgi:hypothetical protein